MFSIRTKLILFTSLLIVIISASICLVFFINQKKVHEEELKKLGSSLVMLLARDNEVKLALSHVQYVLLSNPIKKMQAFDREEEIGYWRISNNNMAVVEEKVSLIDVEMEEIPFMHDSQNPNVPFINRIKTSSGNIFYDFAVPIFEKQIFSEEEYASQILDYTSLEKNQQILGFVQIGLSTHKMNEKINRTILYSIIPAGLGIGLGGICIMFFITRYIVSPLQRLASITKDISKGNFTRTIDIRSKDELGQLSTNFNQMTNTLNEYFNNLKQEITKHKSTANALRESEEKLQSILDNTPAIVYVKDVKGKYIFLNKEIGNVSHIIREEAIGKTDYELFPREVADDFRANDLKVIRAKTPLEFDEIAPHDDGPHTYLSIKFPLYDSNGNIYAVCGISTDISERKRVEEALRISESKYRMLLENLPQRIYYKDKNSVYVSCNENYAEDLKIRPSQIKGKTDYDFYPKEFAEKYRADDKWVLDSGQTEDIEEKYIKDGKEFTIHTVKTPIRDEENNIIGILGIFWDITEKIALQMEAIRTRQLASLGELAAGVAHEVNNPINGIINCAQILIDNSSKVGEEVDMANRIIKEGDRVSNIVNSLLSFARHGDNNNLKNNANIHDILSDTFILVKAQLKREGIKVKLKLPKKMPEVTVNNQQIQQVFLNLTSNARYALNQKYPKTHANKILDILGEEITINNRPYVKITFYDRGTGIPANIKDNVLDPFFTIKTRGEGTGLGLSISHGIISENDGKIIIDSVEGKFTKVAIILPAAEKSS